ncbi:hypothetical protein [Aquipuribacter sp. MA13-6]|uniref:hypothetical protein n=1 Tax=unclassified Aquipuribacter TaxID=2635084 RepID=UPI003EEC6C01
MSTGRRVLLALVTLATVMLGVTGPAAAATAGVVPVASASSVPQLPIPGLPDCQTPPTAESPDRGLGGFITPQPSDPPPLDADPFTDGSGVSVYETTGLAGYRWHMYVDSCVPGPGQATNGALTSTANSLMSLPVLAVGMVATLADTVYNQTWLAVLNEPVAYVSDALYEGFTRPFFPVIAVAVGVLMVISVRRARLSAAIGTGCLVLVAATLAAFAANYPSTVARLTDQVTVTAIVSVNGAMAGSEDADPATATVAPLVDAILYDRWVAGTLGDSSSPTARQYGPELYRASTLTWAETELVRNDPDGAGADLIDAKRQQWTDAAEAVQASDPDAYEYLTGARSLDRVGHALVALALVGILPFLLMSLLLVAMSYLIIRLVVMFLPLVALVALLLKGTLRSLGSLVAAALINSVVFAVGAAVTAYLYGVFLSADSGIPALLGILLAFVVGSAMWIVLSPYRRLTTMVRGNDAVKTSTDEYRKYKKGATDLAGSAARFAGGTAKVAAGALLAKKLSKKDDDEARTQAASEPYRIGPDTLRPEHFATAAPPTSDYRPRTGPPAQLDGAPSPTAIGGPAPAAIAGPGGHTLPAPRGPAGSTDTSPPDLIPQVPTSTGAHAAATMPAQSPGYSSTPTPTVPLDDGQTEPLSRPETTPMRDFDAVVVDGETVTVIHTLDGPVVDHYAPTDAAPGTRAAQVVPGDVVTSRKEGLP